VELHFTWIAVPCCVCRLKLVQLDVTDNKQIADAYDFVECHVGAEGTYNMF